MDTIATVDTGEEEKKDIAKEIIKNAIRSAICIDDSYAAPYSHDTTGLNTEDPKNLFYSFRKNGHCDLDVYQFRTNEDWENHKYLLHNKDLLIQDWELTTVDDPNMTKFNSTLTILENVFKNKILPFVVVYTNNPDLSEVSFQLLKKFNQYNKEDFELLTSYLTEKLKEKYPESEDIEELLERTEINKYFLEYINFPNKRDLIQKTLILPSFFKFLEIDSSVLNEKILIRCINSVIKPLAISLESNEDIFLLLSHVCLSQDRENKSIEYKNIRVNIDQLCYSINGISVLILNKENSQGQGVKVEELFNVFSKSISNNPHSIINLISLELKDRFREDFSKIGTDFNTIDESAFLHHATKYFEEKVIDGNSKQVFLNNSFKNFVINSWIHELLQKNLNLTLDSFSLIEEKIKEHKPKQGDALNESMLKYASMVSCVILDNKTSYKLGFGDVYKCDDDYFLCITPHCDCFNPAKINNEFYFIKTKIKPKLKTALQKAEQNYYSFITNGRKAEAIEWECKPFTSYVNNQINDSENKSINYSGKVYNSTFVCSLKENHAQRIANNSFGHGYRVGIDLPKL